MSKKKREERNVSEPAALKHNPFAALAQRIEAAGPAQNLKTAAPEQAPQKAASLADARHDSPAAVPASATPPGQTARNATSSAGARPDSPAASASRSATPPSGGSAAKPERVKSAGRLVLRRETKGRGGKAVIIVTGFSALANFDESKTLALAQKLKQQLGCGGTVEEQRGEREIILQGDRAAKVAELLRAMNFRVDGVTS